MGWAVWYRSDGAMLNWKWEVRPLTLLDSSLLLLVGQLLLEIGLVGFAELGDIEGGVHCSDWEIRDGYRAEKKHKINGEFRRDSPKLMKW